MLLLNLKRCGAMGALGLTVSWFGCGAGGTAQPASVAPSTPAASAAPAPPASTAARQEAPQPQALPPASAAPNQPETFPSGMIASTEFAGGPAPGPVLPEGSKILHIGDSFAGALGIELNRVLKSRGVVGRLSFEQSTYIPTWAHSKKLPELLASFQPDLVLISLGANELENPTPEDRIPNIRRLVGRLGGRPCVWVAPLLWDGAKSALLDVIRANLGDACVYLDSNQLVLKMPRTRDKIHPSMAARPDWAEITVRWLGYHRAPTAERIWSISP